jgi:hypothetical protein
MWEQCLLWTLRPDLCMYTDVLNFIYQLPEVHIS